MISVIIPLYNKENHVARAVHSVLAQTYKDFELIIVDDGSTDGSLSRVRKFVDSRLKILIKQNGGVSSARNYGLLEASGTHVSFLDADDYWAPNYLSHLVELIRDFPHAGMYGFSNYVSSGGRFDLDRHGMPAGFRGEVSNIWKSGVPYWTSAVTISKAAIDEVGLFDERMSYGEDMDMWWRVLLRFNGVYWEKPLAFYCLDADNRAMGKPMPFERHLPFFIEKYSVARRENDDFRLFCDRECLYRLFQYVNKKEYRYDLKRVLSQIDFTQQKLSMRLRFIFPRCYKCYLKLVGRA